MTALTRQSRYLAELGKDMIVCISAGNEGDSPMYIGKDFTASDSRVKALSHHRQRQADRLTYGRPTTPRWMSHS